MKHFLVPTDFSPAARQALAAAVQLARPLAGRITLLHAVELPAAGEVSPNIFVMKLLQAAKQQLQLLLREAAQHAAEATVQEMLQIAPRRPAILTAFAQQRPDVVVVGTAATARPGSTTEWLVRTAPCPVLVVSHPLQCGPLRTVVVPTDFSDPARQAGPELRRLRAFFPAAALYLLHVAAPDAALEPLRAQLAGLGQQWGLAGSALAIVTATSPLGGIAQFAQRVQADMVVLRVGTRGAGGLWPGPAAPAYPALPPVLLFRLDQEGERAEE